MFRLCARLALLAVVLALVAGSASAASVALSLRPGWNLVAAPLAGVENASACGNFSRWYYRPGTGYARGGAPQAGSGFWIRASEACDLSYNGTTPANQNLSLKAGWNLVGAQAGAFGDGFCVATNCTAMPVLYSYDSAARAYRAEDSLVPGRGYWAYVPQGCYYGASAGGVTVPFPAPLPGAKRDWDVKSDFGAKGDGVTDDYDALQLAAATVSAIDGASLHFPAGVYAVNRYVNATCAGRRARDITYQNCRNIRVYGDGPGKSVVSVEGDFRRVNDMNSSDGLYRFSSYRTVIPFKFLNCTGFTLSDIEAYGNVDKTTKDRVLETSSHGVATYRSSNYVLRNVYAHHFNADGFMIGGGGPETKIVTQCNRCELTGTCDNPVIESVTNFVEPADYNFTLVGLRSSNNARQGLSVILAVNGTVADSVFEETGFTGAYGWHNPGGGIDVEPDYAHRTCLMNNGYITDYDTGNITFRNITLRHNINFEFVSNLRFVHDLTIEDSNILHGNSTGLYVVAVGAANFTLKNSFIDSGAGLVALSDNANDSNRTGLYVFSNDGGVTTIRNQTNHSIQVAYIVNNTINATRVGLGLLARISPTLVVGNTLIYSGNSTPPAVMSSLTGNVLFADNKIVYPTAGWKTALRMFAGVFNVSVSRNNTFTTDLPSDSGKYLYVKYGADTVVDGDYYSPKEAYRPAEFYAWPADSDGHYFKNN